MKRLKGTVELTDGHPCIAIDFKNNVLREARHIKTTDFRGFTSEKLDLDDTDLSITTPLEEVELYPAFLGYLIDNNIWTKFFLAHCTYIPEKPKEVTFDSLGTAFKRIKNTLSGI